MWIIAGIWLTVSLLTGYYIVWPAIFDWLVRGHEADSFDYLISFVGLVVGSLLCVVIMPAWSIIKLTKWMVQAERNKRNAQCTSRY